MTDNDNVNQERPNAAAGQAPVFLPRIDLCETETELLLFADIPGARPEDVDLQFHNGELHLTAKVQPRAQGKAMFRQEYHVGDFQRSFQVQNSIDRDRISAECKNGVLTVHLPKAAEFQPRQIVVQG